MAASVYPNYPPSSMPQGYPSSSADDQCQEILLKPGDFNGLIGFFPPHLMPGGEAMPAGSHYGPGAPTQPSYPPASTDYSSSGYPPPPPQSHNLYPNVADPSSGYPSAPPANTLPYGGGSGSMPPYPSGAMPPYPSGGANFGGAYPPAPGGGQPNPNSYYPPAPSYGGGSSYPVPAPNYGSNYPLAPSGVIGSMGYPPAPSGQGYPPAPSGGGYPPASGGYPSAPGSGGGGGGGYPPAPSASHGYPGSGYGYPPSSAPSTQPASYPSPQQNYGGNQASDDYERQKRHGGNEGMMTDLIGGFIGGKMSGGGSKGGGPNIGGIISGLMSGGKGSGGGGGSVAGMIGNLLGGGGGKNKSGGGGSSGGGFSIAKIIGGLVSGGGVKSGGSNTPKDRLKGGLIEAFGHLVAMGAHKYLGVDPQSGRIAGAVAGNALFGTNGKDNKLGQLGKVILDNIISGKFKRKVDPYVPPQPAPHHPGPPRPAPSPSPGQTQEFYRLRDECLRNRTLFEDPLFPANDNSLFFNGRSPKRIEWLRPGQICQQPQLFVEGHSRFDIVQGELGDCWLLAATAALTLRDELFYRVIPPDQSFTENYAGLFHFQFWQYGHWVDVVIDDRLPTSNGQLLYLHSATNNEFWGALLEKAYAKLYGSYEALKGGTTSEALEDFTGGLTEFLDLKEPPENLLQMMFKAFELGSLMGCSLEADPQVWEARLQNGLVRGHAYSITGMKMVQTRFGTVPLLRIRNPWGNDAEWTGAWSDYSQEWRAIPDFERQQMGLVFAKDGEFWMSFDDFMRNFEKLEICNLGPDVMHEIENMTGVRLGKATDVWRIVNHDGAWIRDRTAGGCRNFLRTFATNPQIMINLQDADPYDDDNLCTCVISVMQKYRRGMKKSGVEMLPIGFAIYQMDNSYGRLDADFFSRNRSCARSPVFINLRSVCGRFRLPPGNYCMVPSTFEPNEEGDFMIRIFTNGLIDSRIL